MKNMTITGGYTELSGGGIYCYSSRPLLESMTVTSNFGKRGGGISFYNYSNGQVKNSLILNNEAHYGGGGIYCSSSSDPDFQDVVIENNTVSTFTGRGGGVSCANNSNPTFTRTLIINNVTTYENSYGGGIQCISGSHPHFIQSTIYGNQCGNSGGALFGDSDSKPILINCILWGNTADQIVSYNDSIVVAYCDIQGGWTGEGNIEANPQFVNAVGGNFELKAGSPCIDAGTASFTWEGAMLIDLSSDEYIGSAPDLGAFEYGMGSVAGCPFQLPGKFDLYRNFPNPFNPTTTISYDLPKTSDVALSIYDITGRLVETLVNKQQDAGNYQVQWDASRYSSGVYFYRIMAGNFLQTRKMLVLR